MALVKDLFECGTEEGSGEITDNDSDDVLIEEVSGWKGCATSSACGTPANGGKKGGCAEGSPLLTLQDESTKTPGLFLVGPAVRHGELSFCFVYKFRQRFGVVADAIARGLGRDTTKAVESCR